MIFRIESVLSGVPVALTLRDNEILKMEIKLNLTVLGNQYSWLGNALYNSYTQKNDGRVEVIPELYDVLLDLSKMTYEEVRLNCRGY
uniref:Uncharacterized protein n=1 Tax=viral metagenome TaxID=1070528 RepID=A0A6C0BCT3_9ZZZZ